MGFTLKENQVALVFSADLEDSGDLTGGMDISIAFPGDTAMSMDARLNMIDVLTMLASFLSYAADKDDLVDELLTYRDSTLEFGSSSGLTVNSPTMGSA